MKLEDIGLICIDKYKWIAVYLGIQGVLIELSGLLLDVVYMFCKFGKQVFFMENQGEESPPPLSYSEVLSSSKDGSLLSKMSNEALFTQLLAEKMITEPTKSCILYKNDEVLFLITGISDEKEIKICIDKLVDATEYRYEKLLPHVIALLPYIIALLILAFSFVNGMHFDHGSYTFFMLNLKVLEAMVSMVNRNQRKPIKKL